MTKKCLNKLKPNDWYLGVNEFYLGVCDLLFGSIYVILLHPTVVVAPTKHDVISMLPKQYTHIKCISLQRSHLVVFMKPRYIDQIKTFSQNLCCRGVKIDKNFGVTFRMLLSNAKTF